jgi:hypothetical protein
MLLRLIESRGDLTLVPPAVLRMDLGADPSARPVRQARGSGPGGARLVRGGPPADRPRPASDEERGSAAPEPTPVDLFRRLEDLVAQLSQSLVAS